MGRIYTSIQSPDHHRPQQRKYKVECCYSNNRPNILPKCPSADQSQFEIGCCIHDQRRICMGQYHFQKLLMNHAESGKYFSYQNVQRPIQGEQCHISPECISSADHIPEIIKMKPGICKSSCPHQNQQCIHKKQKQSFESFLTHHETIASPPEK